MALIVQKYGGTSVGTVERIQAVAEKVAGFHKRGDQVVVVVSAMGNTTNELLELASSVSPNPPRRELDMLVTVGALRVAARAGLLDPKPVERRALLRFAILNGVFLHTPALAAPSGRAKPSVPVT